MVRVHDVDSVSLGPARSGRRDTRCKNDYYASISLNSSLFAKESRFILFIRWKPVARLFIQSVFVTLAAESFWSTSELFHFVHRQFLHFISRSRDCLFLRHTADEGRVIRFSEQKLRLSIFFFVTLRLLSAECRRNASDQNSSSRQI